MTTDYPPPATHRRARRKAGGRGGHGAQLLVDVALDVDQPVLQVGVAVRLAEPLHERNVLGHAHVRWVVAAKIATAQLHRLVVRQPVAVLEELVAVRRWRRCSRGACAA